MDPVTEPTNSDADVATPASSNYSSCDGSEFDRYCSANSALGTASLCSSVGNHSELLDSIKNSSRWNGFDGVLDCVESPRVSNQDLTLIGGLNPINRNRDGSNLALKSVENREAETSGSELAFENGEDLMYYKGKSVIGSDGLSCEVSSSGYGSGEESRVQLLSSNKNVNESGNSLLLNTLVAFGANDWDEFEQERGGDGLGSMSLFDDQCLENHPSINHVDSNDEKETDTKSGLRDFGVSDDHPSNAREGSCVRSKEVSRFVVGETSNREMVDGDELELTITPLCNSIFEQSYNALNKAFEAKSIETEEVVQDLALESIAVWNSDTVEEVEENDASDKSKKAEAFESYNEMVLEMEEILLNSVNSHEAQSTPPDSHHFRDGSSTASTSGADDSYPLLQSPPNINKVEVVGAKQKKGDVSFGERLVGVKEYTIYKLRVYSSKNEWEVERRYRDFFSLYNQLYTLFTDNGLSLPSPWSKVDQESRKIFGNASPDVISHRSVLIQDCLMSLLNSTYPFGTPTCLITFLSPGQIIPNSSLLKSLVPQSINKLIKDQRSKDVSNLGKTISLVVEIKARKSMRQLLEAQHYKCAGCHRTLDAGKTLLREIVQTFGWNKPRYCAYMSELYCGACHTNDTVVLPAKVLHHWDFSLYPVSQLAKLFLESIYDQPMLCVSAVNPFLFSKVPALLHVMGIRKKIGAMLPYVRCPFRKAVQRNLGIRRYLLESNDFFALRDLVDLSKGAFSALPIMVENVSSKILEHITEQCLMCYDSGIPCAARQDCDDPASLIFPFQEAEAAKCGSCGSLFHKPCFVKLMGCCPCGGKSTSNKKGVTIRQPEVDQSIQTSNSNSISSSGFLSEFLSKKSRSENNNNSPVILMGPLPGISSS